MRIKLTVSLKSILWVIPVFLLTSCALRPITSQYSFIKTDINKIKLDELGNGKVLFYNGADILHTLDNTARLNIWLQNKPLGQLKAREYLIIDMKNEKYSVRIQHIDLVNMRSEHDVIINDTTKIIRVEPTIFSNKLTITNKLPRKFEKFKYAKND